MAIATKARKSKARSGVPGAERDVERNALICRHLPLVRHVLKNVAAAVPGHVDREDLFEVGVLGLIDAVERFDPTREVRFSTYATLRIRGAILDAMRNADWLPRSMRKEVTSMDEAWSDLAHKSSRPPTENELAERLGVRHCKLAKVDRASRTCNFQSLDTLHESNPDIEGRPIHRRDDASDAPLGRAVLEEDKARLVDAMAGLPESEQMVISLYYFEDLLLRDIARVLGVSDSRVCQIHRAALKRLERIMAQPKHDLLVAAI